MCYLLQEQGAHLLLSAFQDWFHLDRWKNRHLPEVDGRSACRQSASTAFRRETGEVGARLLMKVETWREGGEHRRELCTDGYTEGVVLVAAGEVAAMWPETTTDFLG